MVRFLALCFSSDGAMRRILNATTASVVTVVAFVCAGCLAKSRLNQAQVASAMDRRTCPITTPNGLQLPPEMKESSPSPYLHGNGKLWTILPLDGTLTLRPERDGSIGDKFPWWRAVPGDLTIAGRRIDGEGTVRSNVPAGYGATGFQSTAIFFSGEGCWEITGRVPDASLTFVLNVKVK
jgi:hypothetical protein